MNEPRKLLIGGFLTLYLVLGLVAACYLAGVLAFVVNKQMPPEIHIDTWFAAWDRLSAIPKQRGYLQFSAGTALFVVFGVPLLLWAANAGSRRALHGDARFARPAEVARAGLFTEERGLIVGRMRGRYLVYPGQQFVLVAAPTRSGKGVGIVIPNLLNFPDSAVVLDVKLENYRITSGFRGDHGQETYLFNPFTETGHTHRWNPLDAIRRDPNFQVGDLLAFAQSLYPSDAEKDGFWNDQARNLFLGLALYLVETPSLPFTLGEMLRQSSGKGQPLKDHLQGILRTRAGSSRPLSETCRDSLSRFVATSDNTLSGIMATFNGPLTIVANPIVDAATSASDFDLADVRRRRMTIYIGIQPNRLADARVLINAFFSQLIDINTRQLPEDNPELRHQCLLLLDEFTALGKIAILAKSVAYMAGYNLRLLPIIQSIAQLQAVYGDRDTRNFVTNHAMQIIFAPREQRDAAEYSEMLGYLTEQVDSRSVSRPLNAFASQGYGRSESRSTHEHRRALMLPQELREMPESQQIILTAGQRPILCEKIRYFDDPTFMERLKPPCSVPALGMEAAVAKAENRSRTLQVGERIVIERLVMRADLPVLDSLDDPSDASVKAFALAHLEQAKAVEEGIKREETVAESDRLRRSQVENTLAPSL
jgi:type IV secretion system protein VirD4